MSATLTISLDDPLERALREQARCQGKSVADLVREILNRTLRPVSTRGDAVTKEVSAAESRAAEPRSLADLFAGRVGLIDSGGREALSQDGGEKLTDHLEAKRRSGHL